jgi:uncharacterized lipoprotein
MKRLALVLALILVVAVAGCQKKSATEQLKSDMDKASNEMKNAF